MITNFEENGSRAPAGPSPHTTHAHSREASGVSGTAQRAGVTPAICWAALTMVALLASPNRLSSNSIHSQVSVTLSPTSIAFGNVPVGVHSSAHSVTLKNTGAAALSITGVSIAGTNSSMFTVSSSCVSLLPAEASCAITVTFTPNAAGTHSATLSVATNALGGRKSVGLAGSGVKETAAAAAPAFSLSSGTYASPQAVTISDATSGATIYYTTNGSTPTTSSTKYSGAISVSSTETLEAIATAGGYSTSAVASATYTIDPPAATPTFSVATGTYTSSQAVTISDATSGSTIYYTTNGSTPTTSSAKYTGAIAVSSTETLEAIAAANGYSTSAVASATYTISVPNASLSASSLSFGNQAMAVTSSVQTLTLTNNGTAPLSITGITFSGANAADFANTADTCGTSLAAGANCAIGVAFTPSVGGSETATISISDNAASNPQAASLSGTGIPDVILSWAASSSSGVVGYNIYRGTASDGESSTPLNSSPIGGTSYTDTNVTAGTTYYYVVTAVSSTGMQSPDSSETSAVVPQS